MTEQGMSQPEDDRDEPIRIELAKGQSLEDALKEHGLSLSEITIDRVEYNIYPDTLLPEDRGILKLFEDGKPMPFGQLKSLVDLYDRFPKGHDPDLAPGNNEAPPQNTS